jgi:hypothetical protein
LAKEVASVGILVTSVEPGGFRTDWAGDSMTYAPKIDGYDTVNLRTDYFSSGQFVPVGDPDKAAKAMIDLANHPEPPIHLILGSEAIALLKQSDTNRQSEMEKWLPVSLSTDHDESVNFLDTEMGKKMYEK